MKILKLLSSNGFISCNKAIARQIGLIEAVLLGELCSVADMFGGEEFYFTQDKITNDTTLSEYQITTSLKKLKEFGIISVQKKGLPCKNYYTINEDKIIELVEKQETSALKIKAQVPENTANCEFRKTSSQKIKALVPEKLDHQCQKNSPTFNNKNTEVRIQNKNTPLEAGSETEELNLGQLQEKLYSIVQEHNEKSDQERKIPVSSSLWTFIQKESRELLDELKNEKPQDILDSFRNYISVAESDSSWKKIFSWKDFVRNYPDYTPDFFSEKKFARKGPASVSGTIPETDNNTDTKLSEQKTRDENKMLDQFENLNGVRVSYAERIFSLMTERNLPHGSYRDFKIDFVSVLEKLEQTSSREMYERFEKYADDVESGVRSAMDFKTAVNELWK